MALTNNLFDIQVHDNLVPLDLQKQVWNYLEQQKWHIFWYPRPALPGKLSHFRPKEGIKEWVLCYPTWPNASFHRCCLGRDEEHLKSTHPLISKLWDAINQGLNNEYEITGYPEDMFDDEYSKQHGEDGWGWRVYVNGTLGQVNTGTWGPHRDTPDLEDETSVTILYCLNLEWYPRWSGEFVFFPEDPEGLTGDHQQFNKGEHMQHRGYNIGWPDQGRIVSPVPGRTIVFDGRCLHNTNPPSTSASYKPQWRIAFRARRKTS